MEQTVVSPSEEAIKQSSTRINPFEVRLENELRSTFAKIPEIAYQMYVDDKRKKEALNNG